MNILGSIGIPGLIRIGTGHIRCGVVHFGVLIPTVGRNAAFDNSPADGPVLSIVGTYVLC